MTGNFRITLAFLKELGARRDGQREFDKAFPDGAGYQETLDKCADEGRVDFGEWLLHKLGPTDDVRVYQEPINDRNRVIIFAGRIEFKGDVDVKHILAGRGIRAGWGIKAGGGIKAGDGIEAGCGIEAGEGIEAGGGYGIFAGIRVKIELWSSLAIVEANTKPTNLISGHWVEPNAQKNG